MGITKLKSQREQHVEKLKAGRSMAFEELKENWHRKKVAQGGTGETVKGKGIQVRQERVFNKGKTQ